MPKLHALPSSLLTAHKNTASSAAALCPFVSLSGTAWAENARKVSSSSFSFCRSCLACLRENTIGFQGLFRDP